jgi:hypothetical protein
MNARASRSAPARRPKSFLIGAGIAAGALALALAVALTGRARSLSATLAAAGCTFRTAPSQGRAHVLRLPRGFRYNTFPPTSGPHAPRPALWGAYDRPVPELELVHNLEHGGIVVQYGARVPRDAVTALLRWHRRDPDALVVAPLPALGDEIALTAWTHVARCRRFDRIAFSAFRDAYRFDGPERFPRSALRRAA